MHRRASIVGALVVGLVLMATACSSSSSTATSAATGSGATDVSGESSTSMSAQDFSFTPAALSGTADQKLTIAVTNGGSTAHNFSITDQDIDVTLEPGQEQDIQVTFPASGSVEFFCSFHESQGMVGELQVQ